MNPKTNRLELLNYFDSTSFTPRLAAAENVHIVAVWHSSASLLRERWNKVAVGDKL